MRSDPPGRPLIFNPPSASCGINIQHGWPSRELASVQEILFIPGIKSCIGGVAIEQQVYVWGWLRSSRHWSASLADARFINPSSEISRIQADVTRCHCRAGEILPRRLRQARWYIAGVHARLGSLRIFSTIASVGEMGPGESWASDALM